MTPRPAPPASRYVIGFVLSIVATLAAYALVVSRAFSPAPLIIAIVLLALVQLAVQLVAFLHIGHRTPVWNLAALAFAIIIIGIVAGGSLWIMNNLNGRMMPGEAQMLQYMEAQAGSP